MNNVIQPITDSKSKGESPPKIVGYRRPKTGTGGLRLSLRPAKARPQALVL